MNEAIFKNKLIHLYQKGYDKEIIKTLFLFIKNRIEQNEIYFSPYELKHIFKLNRNLFLKLVMDLLLSSVFEMQWDIHCPHCRTAAQSAKSVNQIKDQLYCQNCQIDFHSHSDENIVVTFLPDSSYMGEIKRDEMHRINETWRPLYAVELLSYPPFVETFGDQIPAIQQQLRVRSVTVMFTDLEQSTLLYQKLGDIQAFELVREHFDIIFSNVIDSGGGIIKTIGDAVFAIFPDPVIALRVSAQLKKEFEKLLVQHNLQGQSSLKIGLASGPALFVNLNNSLDLFGTTINLASRLVGLASNQHIIVSQTFIDHPKVKQFLIENQLKPEVIQAQLKGLKAIDRVVALPFSKFSENAPV